EYLSAQSHRPYTSQWRDRCRRGLPKILAHALSLRCGRYCPSSSAPPLGAGAPGPCRWSGFQTLGLLHARAARFRRSQLIGSHLPRPGRSYKAAGIPVQNFPSTMVSRLQIAVSPARRSAQRHRGPARAMSSLAPLLESLRNVVSQLVLSQPDGAATAAPEAARSQPTPPQRQLRQLGPFRPSLPRWDADLQPQQHGKLLANAPASAVG